MDAGPILKQIKHHLNGSETTEQLYTDLFEIAAKNLPDLIKGYIEGKVAPKEQDEKAATYCTSKTQQKSTHIFKEDAQINWRDSPTLIERQIRAYTPWPVSWTTLGDLSKHYERTPKKDKDTKLRIKVHKSHLENKSLKIK